MSKICPVCEEEVEDSDGICLTCGYVFSEKNESLDPKGEVGDKEVCPHCGSLVDTGISVCAICGYDFREEYSSESIPESKETTAPFICTNCGEPIQADMKFCPNCGRSLSPSVNETRVYSNITPNNHNEISKEYKIDYQNVDDISRCTKLPFFFRMWFVAMIFWFGSATVILPIVAIILFIIRQVKYPEARKNGWLSVGIQFGSLILVSFLIAMFT